MQNQIERRRWKRSNSSSKRAATIEPNSSRIELPASSSRSGQAPAPSCSSSLLRSAKAATLPLPSARHAAGGVTGRASLARAPA